LPPECGLVGVGRGAVGRHFNSVGPPIAAVPIWPWHPERGALGYIFIFTHCETSVNRVFRGP
jgi:hypothetical protein